MTSIGKIIYFSFSIFLIETFSLNFYAVSNNIIFDISDQEIEEIISLKEHATVHPLIYEALSMLEDYSLKSYQDIHELSKEVSEIFLNKSFNGNLEEKLHFFRENIIRRMLFDIDIMRTLNKEFSKYDETNYEITWSCKKNHLYEILQAGLELF